MAAKKTTPKKKSSVTPVVLGASIEHGAVSDWFDAKKLPAELAKVLAEHKAGKVAEKAACATVAKYLAANFISSNLDDETIFDEPDDVWADKVECYALSWGKSALPKITAGASFTLTPGKNLPKNEDAMMDWEDENTPLTDAVNFFWRFGDTELVMGDHEGAGAGLEEYPE